MTDDLANRRVLLIIGGGIAAYKSLYLIRALRARGASVTGVLTKGGGGIRHGTQCWRSDGQQVLYGPFRPYR